MRSCLIAAAVLFTFSRTLDASQLQRPPAETTARGAIEGLILYTPETPVPNVTIVAREAGRISGGAVSDLDGHFRVQRLPAGRFDLEVSRGAESLAVVSAIELAEGETKSIRVEVRISPTARLPSPQRPDELVPIFTLGDSAAIPAEQPGIERPPEPVAAPVIETLQPGAEFIPVVNRWRNLAPWTRYPTDPPGGRPYARGRWWDSYNQNKLKGDYPILGRRWFLSLSAISDTQIEGRRAPDEVKFNENLALSAELFRGVTVFRPFDFRFRITPAFNWNRSDTDENASRWGSHAAVQEAFAEARLAEVSPAFDVVSLRVGTQFFSSDFRGFIFSDNEPGVRLFGTFGANRHQYNLAYFEMVRKDADSTLNTFRARHQGVWIANYYIQDFLRPGYTTEFSIHANRERSGDAVYFGWAGDGHFGRLNVNHAAYQVVGKERLDSTAASLRINAQMAALELSMDRDWLRYRVSGFYASGDNDSSDSRAKGFDSILDDVVFGGGPLSLWSRQDVRLAGFGLKQRFSLVPSLRADRDAGQSNFVNPGLMMFSAGADAELTPKLRASATASYLSFAHTNVLEAQLLQSNIRRSIGVDLGLGATWRPFLNNNMVIRGGASTLLPGAGFRGIYTPQALLSSFLEVRVAY